MEANQNIQNVIECIKLQSSKIKPKEIQKYNPIFKKLNNNYYYINNIPEFQVKSNLKILETKYGKSYLLTDIKFPYVFKKMYLSVVEKFYGMDEEY